MPAEKTSAKRAGTVRVGTSGWHYKHWRGPFYPEKMPPRDYLAFYHQHLDTVEINNSFYMQPSVESVRAWHDEVPSSFLFAFKAHRFITHMKKLNDPVDPLRRLYEVVSVLGSKAGAILFQLPPFWKVNEDRLAAFLQHLAPEYRHAFEFRHPSWFTDRVLDLLEEYGQGLCIFDLGGNVSPRKTTADLVYIRLHGPQPGYKGSYSELELRNWSDQLATWQREGRDVLCYFDNDDSGYAAANAITLRKMMDARPHTRTTPSTPATRG